MESNSKSDTAKDLVEEFHEACGEYLFCLMFASKGIEINGDLIAKERRSRVKNLDSI